MSFTCTFYNLKIVHSFIKFNVFFYFKMLYSLVVSAHNAASGLILLSIFNLKQLIFKKDCLDKHISVLVVPGLLHCGHFCVLLHILEVFLGSQ